MDVDVSSLQKNKPKKLVELLERKRPIGCNWVFRTKYKANGSIDKYKVRLVVKGYA
jgi:hypothetical protein